MLLLLVLVAGFVFDFLVIDKKEIYTSVIFSDHSGFDLNSSSLTFGMILPGDSSLRSIVIKNDFNSDGKVSIGVQGGIKDFLTVSENDFILKPGEEKEINFTVFAPDENLQRKYDGKIIIKLKRCLK